MSGNEKDYEARFQFVLRINDNIICRRYFDIWGYNHDFVGSKESDMLMDELMGLDLDKMGKFGMIMNNIKIKSKNYLWYFYNPYIVQNSDEIEVNDIYEHIDYYHLDIMDNDKVIAHKTVCANIFPPKVRKNVNIRDLVYDIISTMRNHMCRDEYSYS